MKNMIIIAEAVNAKIDRVIKTLEKTRGIPGESYFRVVLESMKVKDIRINTDGEVYVTFMDLETMRFKIERDLI